MLFDAGSKKRLTTKNLNFSKRESKELVIHEAISYSGRGSRRKSPVTSCLKNG